MMYDIYDKALKLGKREMALRKSRHEDPYLPVLDEVVPGALALPARPLRLVSIPLNQIVGTATHGRTTAFAANFMPAIDEHGEFVAKWERLYESVVSEGVNSPIKAYEYMNRFYVIEGNKRVSVMKYLDAAAIEGDVIRLIPPRTDEPANKIYYEFLSFYDDTEINYISFSKEGGFALLYEYTGTTPGEKWSSALRRDFHSALLRFSNAYHALNGSRLPITDGDAFLIFLRIYGFAHAGEVSGDQLREDVRKLWDEIRISAQEERVVLLMEPTASENASFLSTLLRQKKITAAFLYSRQPSESGWTYWHEMGRSHVNEVLEGQVDTLVREANSESAAEDALGELAEAGTDVVFTTSPVFLNAAIKASVQHPGMKVLNCSLLASFHHVRSYYLRVHEAKFIIGAIAGAMADNNRIGYIADYPIYGTPASINAFALGARLVNPRAQVFLDWSSCRDHDVFETFRRNDISIICNRDISAPAHASREFGLYRVEKDGTPRNLAMPVWNWGSLYETILRSLLSGSWNDDSESADGLAMAYWPGISTGAVDVFYSQRLPDGVQQLVEMIKRLLQSGSFNLFSGKIVSQDGAVHSEIDEGLSPAQVIAMDWLCDNVIGSIPDLAQLKPEAHPLVRLQGINDTARPDPSSFAWTGAAYE